MENILLFGASGHSKMIIDIILKNNTLNLLGFIDSFKTIGESVHGFEVLGNESHLSTIVEKHNITGIIIGIGDNNARLKVKKQIESLVPKLKFLSVIHPSAIIASDVTIPEGTVIMSGAIINADAKVGKFCILNTKSSLGHDSVLEDYASLASGVTIGGNVKIGHSSAICLSASIIPGIVIGKNTVIGTGAIVLKSIGDNLIAYGNPAKVIRERPSNGKYLG